MKPYYILFKHNPNYPELMVGPSYSICKCFDDSMVRDSPAREVVEYYASYKEAQLALRNIKERGDIL
tara:strand:- start:166 stop:366 length:201 start_codon:yes stop_codon:yes gene_type:complete